MNEAHARDEVCRVGKSLFDRGYVHGTAGNISVRLATGYLITPTDACLGFLDPARLALVDGEVGVVFAPGGRPRVVFAFVVENGRIAEIELIADAQRIGVMDVAIE